MFHKTTALLLKTTNQTKIFRFKSDTEEKGYIHYGVYDTFKLIPSKEVEFFYLYLIDTKNSTIVKGDWVYNLIIQEAYEITEPSVSDNAFLRNNLIKILASNNPNVKLPSISDNFIINFLDEEILLTQNFISNNLKGVCYVEYETKYIEPEGIHSNRGYDIDILKINENNEAYASLKDFRWTDKQKKEIQKIIDKYDRFYISIDQEDYNEWFNSIVD